MRRLGLDATEWALVSLLLAGFVWRAGILFGWWLP